MNNNIKIIDLYSHLKNRIIIKIDPKEILQWDGIVNVEWANECIVETLEGYGWTAEVHTSPWQKISGCDCSAELIYVQNLVAEITKEVANEMKPEVIAAKQEAVKNLEAILNSLENNNCLSSNMKLLIDCAIEELI